MLRTLNRSFWVHFVLTLGLLYFGLLKEQWYLAWVMFVPWLVYTAQRPQRRIPWLWFALGWGWHLILISWLIPTTFWGYVALSAACGAVWGVWAWVWTKWPQYNLGMALLWALLEVIRAYIGDGFPWFPIGVSQIHNASLAPISSWVGISGISALIMGCNLTLVRPTRKTMIGLMMLLLMAHAAGWKMAHSQSPALNSGNGLTIVGVNSQIGIEEKWDPSQLMPLIRRYQSIAQEKINATTDLVIWPETAVPEYATHMKEIYQKLAQFCQTNHVELLFGCLDVQIEQDYQKKYYNTMLWMNQFGAITQEYHKIKLVPWGEYNPWQNKFPKLSALIQAKNPFDSGRELALFHHKGWTIANIVCYEDMFPSFVRQFVKKGAELVIVTSNDAWFAPEHSRQRLDMLRFRALENKRPMVRVANGGYASYISETGEVLDAFTQEGPLCVSLNKTDRSLTPYTRWGDSWLGLLTGGYFIFIVVRRLRLFQRKKK